MTAPGRSEQHSLYEVKQGSETTLGEHGHTHNESAKREGVGLDAKPIALVQLGGEAFSLDIPLHRTSWSVADRMFSMGHSSAMTQHYAVSDLQRRRVGVEEMARLLAPPTPLPPHTTPEGQGSVPEGHVTTELEGRVLEGSSDPVSTPIQHQEGFLKGTVEKVRS